MIEEILAPVEVGIEVPLSPERAFALLITDMKTWWPLDTHSVFEGDAIGCGVEPRVGGAVYEESRRGARSIWGTVVVWEPPHRIAFTWHPGRDASTAQQVEIVLTETGSGTRVHLKHFGWETLGEEAAAAREGYTQGWNQLLTVIFAEAARRG